MIAQQDVVVQAANIYTSGQFFGLLLVLVVGMLLVTNEFHHQTVTTTFLTTPQRTRVITAKLVAAVLIGVLFWVVTTAINLVVGALWLNSAGYGAQLGESGRHPIGVAQPAGVRDLGDLRCRVRNVDHEPARGGGHRLRALPHRHPAASLVFYALSVWLDNPTILEWQVIVPSIASMLMITGGDDIPGSPPQWVGAVILIGYAVVTGTIGTLITRKRDIS